MNIPSTPTPTLARDLLPRDARARWTAIPGVFAALYRADPRLTIAGFQAHAQQGILRLLEVLSTRAGSGFVDLDRTLLAVYDHFVPALLAFRDGGTVAVRALGDAIPSGVADALDRVDRGEISSGNLDLLWSEQPMVQREFYGRHRVLAWWMSRGAALDFGTGPQRYPRRLDPCATLGDLAQRMAWDRELWQAWDRLQTHPDQLARIDAIVAAGRAAGADLVRLRTSLNPDGPEPGRP